MRGRGRDGETETETNLNSHLKSTLLLWKNYLMPLFPPVSVIIKCLKHSKSHMYVAKPTKGKNKPLFYFYSVLILINFFFKDRAILRYYSLVSSFSS